MLEREQLLKLMKATANGNPSTTYSVGEEKLTYAAMNETVRQNLNELVGSDELYRENQNKLFSLVEQVLSDILPARVLERYGMFAEVKTFAQGDKPIFVRRIGRQRAKQFITRVGLAGVYEVFKLGNKTFELPTSAIGGAANVAFEEFLDGRVDFNELIAIVLEGMDEIIYREIAAELIAAIGQLPPANRTSVSGFDEAEMDRVISVAAAYGVPTIYCTREFAVKMIPTEGWAGMSDNMKDRIWSQGYLGDYKGNRVIVLPQSFEDETNAKKVIDPGYAWIIPSGGNDKPVKVAFEGSAHARQRDNDDWSKTFEIYQKVGVGVIMTNNIAVYEDTSLAGHLDTIPTL